MLGIGTNGGLIGPRRVPSTGSASGVWDPEEQKLAKGAGIWPTTGVVIPINQITYTQSSVYEGTVSASNANMTNKVGDSNATALGDMAPFIKMDLGSDYLIGSVIIGDGASISGWGKSYTQNLPVFSSVDDSTWTLQFNTGLLPSLDPPNNIHVFNVNFSARYIRIGNPSTFGYIALTEFYALAPGQIY